MAFSIRTKVLFPAILLALMMILLVASAWYALNKTTDLNDSLAGRFNEIEEVREIEVLFSELIYPHLTYITSPSDQAANEIHEIFHEIKHIVDELNEMEVVNEEEREIAELVTQQMTAVEKLSEQILHPQNSNHANSGKGHTHNTTLALNDHMSQMNLLNKISSIHISKVRLALNEWHNDEIRQVDVLAKDTKQQLSIFSNGVIVLTIIMVSIVIFSLWLNNYVLIRPVVSLSQSTNQFASGDLKSKAPVFAQDELGNLAKDINKMASSLDDLYGQLATLAKTDQLTNLINRHGFVEILERESRSASRYDAPLTLLILDIDHFKNINDTYGHDIGDIAIKTIAQTCIETFRDCDYCVRYGGEEFIVLMPQTKVEAALGAAERLRKLVSSKSIIAGNSTFNLTMSVGLAQYNKAQSTDQLIKNADQALYIAKNNGRNQSYIKYD